MSVINASDRVAIAALALGLLVASAALAGPPPNDDCTNAATIDLGTTPGTTIGATDDGDATCGNSDGSPDVWYSYTAPSDQFFSATTCRPVGTDYDTVVSIHTGCPGVATNEVSCSDDDPACAINGRASTAKAILSADETVLIRVSGFEGDSGNFLLVLGSGEPLTNDSCADAAPIGPGTYFGNTRFATTDGDASCGESAASPDVWFRYTPAENGLLGLTTCGAATDYDTAISVHSACPGDLTSELACADDNENCPIDPLHSTLLMPVTASTTHFIRVSGFEGASGRFGLSVSGPESDGFSLATSGQCPGLLTIAASGAAPNAVIGLANSTSAGKLVLPGGACAGSALDLGAGALFMGSQQSDAEGNLTVQANAPAAACPLLLQAFDMTTCEASNLTSARSVTPPGTE